jgi:hypothetical protein
MDISNKEKGGVWDDLQISDLESYMYKGSILRNEEYR